jgi:thiol-disulfide isomerase/thioredoxin
MTIIQKALIAGLCFISYKHLPAQQKIPAPLKVGDSFTESILNSQLTYPDSAAGHLDVSGKLLILEFWDTRCGACIDAFPKMELLQRQFEGKLKVLLVTNESKERVKSFFAIRKSARGLNNELISIVQDSILRQFFPHIWEPHFIWISSNGKVSSITNADEVNKESIIAIMNNLPFNLPQKTDLEVSYDENKLLFINGNGGPGERILFHSVLSKYTPGLPFFMASVNADGSSGSSIQSFNQPIERFYQIAYEREKAEFFIPESRTILKLRDTVPFVGILNGKLNYESLYCYELKVPKSDFSSLKDMMKTDLKRYFGLDARIEKLIMPTLVFHAGDTTIVHSKGGHPQPDDEISIFKVKITNLSFSRLFRHWVLAEYVSDGKFPLVDETNIRGNVDINIPAVNMSDWKSLAAALKPYNIYLEMENRETEVLVIRDAK